MRAEFALDERSCVKQQRRLTGSSAVGGLAIIADYFQFLRQQKKWWMLPIVTLLLVLGMLVWFTQGSPLAPFIYTIF